MYIFRYKIPEFWVSSKYILVNVRNKLRFDNQIFSTFLEEKFLKVSSKAVCILKNKKVNSINHFQQEDGEPVTVTGTITGFVDYQITSLATTPTVAPQPSLTSTSTAASTDPKNICHAGDFCNDKACKDRTAPINIIKATLCDH